MPVWLIFLSDQLLIVALVGHYPTNWLIRRRPILWRPPKRALLLAKCIRYCRRFLAGIPNLRAGIHVLLTRPPLPQLPEGVRLACVRHAASVYPEPGSNSPSKNALFFTTIQQIVVKGMSSCDPGQSMLLGCFSQKN